MVLRAVFVKELQSYLGLFLAYAIVAVTLALCGFFFYTDISFFMMWGGQSLERGLWEFFFHDLRYVLLLLVPAITARSFAEEKKLGTLDLLWTYPIPESSVLLGKFLAAATLLLVVLGLTLLYPLLLSWWHPDVSWLALLPGYTGLFLIGLVFISVGLLLSALTDSQAIAAMATLGVLVLFWSLTWNEQAVSETWLQALLQISLFDRFYNFARGAIDTQEITFFLFFFSFFLLLTWQALRSRRWRGRGEFSSFTTFLSTPSRKQWITVAVLDVLILLGLVGVQTLSIRNNVRWDFTPTQTLSLSKQTKGLLADLKTEALLTLFFGGSPDSYQRYEDVLKRFTAENAYFQYRILHRDRNVGLARQYGATHYGTAVLEYDGQRKLLPGAGEKVITEALFQFLREEEKTIYFVGGHGEKDPRSGEPQLGYSEATSALHNENFVVRPFFLARTERVPEDAALVVVSGPQTDLLPAELERLSVYLSAGGSLLFMLDPMPAPNLTAFLSQYGVRLEQDIVYDPQNRLFGGDALSPLVSLYNTGVKIVQNFKVGTIFPLSRSVEPVNPLPSGVLSAQPFCRTGPGSWARFRAGTESLDGAVDFEGTKARPGPISLAVAATIRLGRQGNMEQSDQPTNGGTPAASEDTTPEQVARLVVYGDSDFASNARLSLLGNRDLFLNTVQWLVQDEKFITERPRDASIQRKISTLVLTAEQTRQLFLITIVAEPGVILLLGTLVSIYRRRRRR